MTISQTSTLCKPSGSDRIPRGHLGYMRARNKYHLYSLVIKEFKQSGLSQAELARRLGKKKADIVCRWLAAPGNWTLNTVSDLLFAISGAEIDYSTSYPLDKPPRNYGPVDFLNVDDEPNNQMRIGSSTSNQVLLQN